MIRSRLRLSERRRLMVLSAIVLVSATVICVGSTSYQFFLTYRAERQALLERLHDGDDAPLSGESLSAATASKMQNRWLAAAWFSGGTTLIVLFGGGALLLRVNNAFIKRLERSEAAMARKATTLAQMNRELDDFSCIASHDLKEPLHGIRAYCEILEDHYREKLDDSGRRMLRSVATLCERLSRSIDDLLTYARMGRAQPRREPIALDDLTRDVLERLAPAMQPRGAQVRVAGPLPTVSADPTLVGEVLLNLVANALKFAGGDSPVIEIGTRPGDVPVLYVKDNGIGIPSEHHEEIFEMFRRLHSRREYAGTGAGLSIVRKIVEAHGGRIWVESEPGHGATFLFTLAPAIEPRLARAHAHPPAKLRRPRWLGRRVAPVADEFTSS